ncbi:Kinesin light chain 3 [Rhizoclosmatium sp. JEL0117]|nr:Kinesin light chain 3 [Rhizoclosmatium sp. JEL0117]
MTSTHHAGMILDAIAAAFESTPNCGGSDAVLSAAAVGAAQKFSSNSAARTPWPPRPSVQTWKAANLDKVEASLVGFAEPGSPVKHVVEGIQEKELLLHPREAYDVAVSNILFWSTYTESFKTLYTLATNNHHPSKLFFSPDQSPISARYNDIGAAYLLGLFLADLGLINLAAEWFRFAANGGHASAMLEFGKILCTPGWAHFLTHNVSESSPTINRPNSPISLSPNDPSFDNVADTSLALSFLSKSYNLSPSSETAFTIGMIYLTSPSRNAFTRIAGLSPLSTTSPHFPKSPTVTSPSKTSVHSSPVFRDLPKAVTWLSRASKDITSDDLFSITAAYQLANIYLQTPSQSMNEKAVALLRTVCGLSTLRDTDAICVAPYLLSLCLRYGIGTSKKLEEAHAWCNVSDMQRLRDYTLPSEVAKSIAKNKAKLFRDLFRGIEKLVERDCKDGMLAYGLCWKFGVGCSVDSKKAFHWIERAGTVQRGKDVDMLLQIKDVSEVAALFGGKENKVSDSGIVLVAPPVPNIVKALLVDTKSVASLPPLPSNYTNPVKPQQNHVDLDVVYPPPSPIDDWLRAGVTVEETIDADRSRDRAQSQTDSAVVRAGATDPSPHLDSVIEAVGLIETSNTLTTSSAEVEESASQQPVSIVDAEHANMLNPRVFSIKGLPLSHLPILINLWGGSQAVQNLTTAQVCEKYLKPMTKASGLSLCAQLYLSPDPLLSSQVQDAKNFISHAWQYKFLDVVEALFHFAIQSNLNPETTIIWFDLFSNSQHNTAEKTFDWWQTVFMNAIKEIVNVVMVMQPWSDPIPLKRVWCLFEIYATAVTQSNFYVAMTVSEESKFLVKLMDDITSFQQIFSNVNILKTQSFNPSDRDAIFDVIQKTVGFSKLDQLVFQKLTQWMGGTITKELLKHNDDKVAAFKLAHALGNFFKDKLVVPL